MTNDSTNGMNPAAKAETTATDNATDSAATNASATTSATASASSDSSYTPDYVEKRTEMLSEQKKAAKTIRIADTIAETVAHSEEATEIEHLKKVRLGLNIALVVEFFLLWAFVTTALVTKTVWVILPPVIVMVATAIYQKHVGKQLDETNAALERVRTEARRKLEPQAVRNSHGGFLTA